MALEKGLVGEVEHEATPETSACNYANPGVDVLATPVVVAWIEEAAMQATQGHLEKGQTTVGTVVNIKHMAATPLGMKVKARAHLKEVDGRRLVFAVEAFDEMEK
ncbi:MAG: thioesterase, partial [candidate division NC10 bacterium]|nr:thioesterase [candidate division NC10 bacterium]